MTPDRWPEVERLYEKVMALPVDGRPAFLAEACVGDDALRREVEGLLNLETAATDFLEQPALRAAVNTLSRALPHLAPPNVPGYDIIRELGEGGMGVVYLAEQRTPLQRTVALKLIRPGMDSRQVLARFERERQALARMDHPNIAAVFDAGSTLDGRPYFVMEFVDGVPITEYCDRRNLSVRARLSLFIQICNAVQHAHQKGVIHRDLKPSNVLVIEQDGQAVPKVIDFGTAKSADPADAQTTLTTVGLVFGTVAYMSPEQAAFSSDIDTTTDVYSLGVLLFELLVGCTPFDRHKVQTDGLDAMLRAIRDSDPPRPSTLVTRDKDFRASIAARGTEVGLLAKQLSGDLDWIVLKSLEKDRRRRYSTAASLGADVQRFLDSRPIEARPPSVPYRVRKFTRRYRGPVTAIGSVAATLILGLVASTIFYRQGRVDAERSAEQAEIQRAFADLQRKTADTAMRSALRSRVEAESQREKATAALDSLRIANGELANQMYASTITAADSELRSGKLTAARERLRKIPAAQRNWEWWYLFNQTDDSVFKAASATPACLLGGPSRAMSAVDASQVLSFDATSRDIVLRRCGVVETWAASATKTGIFASPPTSGSAGWQTVLAVDPSSKAMVVVALHPPPGPQWSVRVFYPRTQQIIELGKFAARPGCADLSRDGERIALGLQILPGPPPRGRSPTNSFEVWRIGTGRIFEFRPQPVDRESIQIAGGSCQVKFSPDGTYVASSGGTVDVWKPASGVELLKDTVRPGLYVQPIAFSPSGDRLAIGRANGSIDVVQLTDPVSAHVTLSDGRPEESLPATSGFEPLRDLLARSKAVVDLSFSGDGVTLASAAGTTVTVWDLPQRKSRAQPGHSADVVGVAISADGRVVYSVDAAGQLRGWPVRLPTAVAQSPLTFSSMSAMPLNVMAPLLVSDGPTVAVGTGRGGSLSILRLPEQKLTELLQGESLRPLALAHDGSRLYVTGSERSLRVLDVSDGRTLQSRVLTFDDLNCHVDSGLSGDLTHDPITNLTVSHDNRYLAFHRFGCVIVWDAVSLRRVGSTDRRTEMVSDVMFRQDGALIISRKGWGNEPRSSIEVWDWRVNKTLATIYPKFDSGSQNVPWRLTQSADGQRIGLLSFAFGLAATLSIWDRELKNEIGHWLVGDSTGVALSPDGSRAVTVSRENASIQVWDVARSVPLLTLVDTEAHPSGVAFTKSGQIIAGRWSGGVTVFDPRISNPR